MRQLASRRGAAASGPDGDGEDPQADGGTSGAVRRGARGLREQRDVRTGAPCRPTGHGLPTARRPRRVGGGGGGGGGDQPTGDPAAMAQKMAQSLGEPQAGTPARGNRVAAQAADRRRAADHPRAAELPGQARAAMPGGGPSTGTPKLPTDPGLRPAAARRRRRRRGGGGGGGGPRPVVTRGDGRDGRAGPPMPVAAAPAAATAAAGLAGRRDGRRMAPMHGAQGGVQGKEKRRDPRTAPDEDLYTEDRPWTEAVIGNRRRKDVHDGRNSLPAQAARKIRDRRHASGGCRRPAAGAATAVADG